MTDTIPELDFIKDPSIIGILKTIKQIQARMKQPDLVSAQYAVVYQTLLEDFPDLSDSILRSVISGDKNGLLASILYHKSKELEGSLSETELSKMLAKKYKLPEI